MSTFEQITNILQEFFDIAEVEADHELIGQYDFDDLDGLEFQMALEEEFDMEITDDEWGEIKTVQHVIDLINRKLGVAESAGINGSSVPH